MLNQKDFMKLALKFALPVMIQNLISTLVSSADTVMLGYVNQTAMSASSLANQYTFVLMCFYFGMATATSVLCGQYWGKKDVKTIERIIGLSTRISLLISTLFFAIGFFFPEAIMRLLTNSPDTIAAGGQYLRVVSVSFVFMGFSQVFLSAVRSVGKVVLPSVTYVISLCTNVLFNAAFIFGLFGLPKLGVVGVAVGTVIARIVECLICLGYSAVGKEIRFRVRYLFERAGVLFSDVMKISVPAIANDIVWSLATTVFAAILGHIGDDMVAANAVAIMVVNIGAIAMRGFCSAATVIVSNELGKNDLDTAKEYSKRMLRLTILVGLVGCIVIVLIRPFMMNYYADKLSTTAVSYLGSIMFMTTWRLVGEGINTCLICGFFRAGGDSKYGLIMDSVFMWGVAVPIMAIAAYVIKLPPIWVYFVMSLDEIYKIPVVWRHYTKYEWMKNITREME